MQVEVVVAMERRPVTVGEYEAKDVRYVDHNNDKCIYGR